MTSRIRFKYGDFYDFPRMLVFTYKDEWYLMRSYFDEGKDDYADVYDVYRLPHRTEAEVEADPSYFTKLRLDQSLGQVPITDMGFDASRRQSISADAFERWIRSIS